MKKIISLLCITTILTNLTACGTILYPERKGHAGGGQLDPSIVVLDGVGLLCFIVPGVIAYAVDFSNGTIYLPGGSGKHHSSIESFDKNDMTAVNVGKENLTPEMIHMVVSANAGQDVDTAKAKAYKVSANGEKVAIDYRMM